jgi:hypothetical protein
MAAFEHVMTLLSFVFALTIAHLLSSVIALVRAGSRVRYSFTHAVWMFVSLLLVLVWWLSFWDFRVLKSWDVGTIVFTLGGTMLVYLYAGLVSPEVSKEGRWTLGNSTARMAANISRSM